MAKGYDLEYVELYWISLCIVLIVLCKRKMIYFLPLLLFPPFFLVVSTIITILLGKKDYHRTNVKAFFHNYIKPKILGHKLPDYPSIIVANYPTTYLEYLANYLLSDNICILLYKGSFIQSRIVKYFYSSDQIIFVGRGKEFLDTQNKIKSKIDSGYTVLVYAEKRFYDRPSKYDISRLHSGIFSIAKNAKIPITPIVFDHIDHDFGIVTNSNYKIYIDKPRYVTDVQKEMDMASKLFRKKLKFFKIKL